MKKPLVERFQQLAGIKPLYEVSSPLWRNTPSNERFDKAQEIIDEYIQLWGDSFSQGYDWLSLKDGEKEGSKVDFFTWSKLDLANNNLNSENFAFLQDYLEEYSDPLKPLSVNKQDDYGNVNYSFHLDEDRDIRMIIYYRVDYMRNVAQDLDLPFAEPREN